MKDPKHRVTNPRGFFISLAKQLSLGQVPLDHIDTPEERLMREYAERSKEKRERLKVLELETFEFEFQDWLETLSDAVKLGMIPESQFVTLGSPAHTSQLKQQFKENIWPELKLKISQGNKLSISDQR
jgi:hypothetical protein